MNEQNLPYKQFDDMKCIWMSSNLVEYKLCDKDFDCENCEFDKVMRNQAARKRDDDDRSSPGANFFAKLIEKLKNDAKFRNPPYYYLKNNLVVKNLFGNIYYIGINPAMLLMLECLNSVRFLTNGDKYVQQGVPFLRVQGEWGSVQINSPIAFFFLNKSDFEPVDFLTNEWFGLIEANREDVLGVSFNERDYDNNITNLKTRLNTFVAAYPETGVTMMDGGKNVRYLYVAIGTSNYLKLLSDFFALK